MPTPYRPFQLVRPSPSFGLLLALFAILWLAGGASRADVLGQAVVRGMAWAALLIAALFAAPPSFRGARPVVLILLAALALPLAQLVPLSPNLWQQLPGREVLAGAAAGQPQPWRPWTMTPGTTVNAASSLVVPLAVLVLWAGLRPAERAWLPGVLLALVAGSSLIGLLQFSGAKLNNPFVNDSVGQVSGTFANRNHFAIFLALGCLLAPAWAFPGELRPRWRGVLALGLVLLFALTILASGSRAGMFAGLLAIPIGLLLVQHDVRRQFRRAPRWVFPATVAGIFGTIALFVLISIAADRAESVNRILAADIRDDMRSRGLPTVWAMIEAYLPVGSGLGGFDPLFRMHEPLALLKPTYFNHAHNDFLEIVLDAGVPGLLLLLGALVWWIWASLRAWRARRGAQLEAKLGSAMLLIVLVASTLDYPARTPMMMAVVVIAGLWLSCPADDTRSALPKTGQHL